MGTSCLSPAYGHLVTELRQHGLRPVCQRVSTGFCPLARYLLLNKGPLADALKGHRRIQFTGPRSTIDEVELRGKISPSRLGRQRLADKGQIRGR
jgi:hypothetical protein